MKITKEELERMVLDNLDLVKIIATKISSKLPSGIELDDLIHTGIIGLIESIHRFEPSKGVKFSTFASLRIRGAILDELRNLDWATRTLRKRIKDVEKVYSDMEHELGRPPEIEEVAKKLNMSLDDFNRLLEESKGVGIGVFRYIEDDNRISENKLLRYYDDPKASSPIFYVEKEELRKKLTEFIEQLPEREKLVLSLYYVDDLNLKEIAKVLNLTESRISQIRSSALLRLRSKLKKMAEDGNVSIKEIL